MTHTKLFDKKMTNIKERISQLPSILGIRKGAFFDSLGVSSSNYRGVALKSEVSTDVIVEILSIYPEVNSEWILLGRGNPTKELNSPQEGIQVNGGIQGNGNILLGKQTTHTHHTPQTSNSEDTPAQYLIEVLQEQLNEKDKQIQRLTELLSLSQSSMSKLLESKKSTVG